MYYDIVDVTQLPLRHMSRRASPLNTMDGTCIARSNAAGKAAIGMFWMSLCLSAIFATKPGVSWGQNEQTQTSPIVETAEGPLRGLLRDGVYQFLGVPYAAAPVGERRWMPPEPVTPWTPPFEATRFGQTCPQVTELGSFAGPTSVTEDCLYLNVFTSKLAREGAANAVLVWIHGGGNIDGESNDYDATKLATGGPLGTPIVVVTLNYRLGLFGFLAHPSLGSNGHPIANYGILDIQAALRWVKRNIRSFGGDPNRVALGGQSAGADNTAANLVSPLAAGLFNRALFESGPVVEGIFRLSDGVAAGMAFAKAAGCPGEDAQAAGCLRQLPVARILQLQGTPKASGPYVTGPTVDGTIIPIPPESAYATGRFNRMPILGGNTADELTFDSAINEYFTDAPQATRVALEHQSMLSRVFSAEVTREVLAEYPISDYSSSQFAASAAMTDYVSMCASRHVVHSWSKFVPVYQYEFDYRDAPFYFPHMSGFAPLAAHTSDVQFLFKNWHGSILGVNLDQATGQPRELNKPETQLSDRIVAFVTKFVSTGNPNASGNFPWPRFTTQPGAPAILSENVPTLSRFTDAEFAAKHHCVFWGSILGFTD